MVLQETYKFPKSKFDSEGVNIETSQYFMVLVEEFERDFNKNHPTCFPNHLFANNSTMILFNRALKMGKEESCVMDLINGEVDLDTNLAIEEFSDIQTIYAIGSKIKENEDEPIFLVTNDKISSGTIVLKYIPDDDSEKIEPPNPVVKDYVRVQ